MSALSPPLSPAEVSRRAVALTVAETRKPAALLPRPLTPTLSPPAAGRGVATAGADAPAPVVTVTIAGPARAGKSVLAHLIREALAYHGIACTGPEGLRSLAWRNAVHNLIDRGLAVTLVKTGEESE